MTRDADPPAFRFQLTSRLNTFYLAGIRPQVTVNPLTLTAHRLQPSAMLARLEIVRPRLESQGFAFHFLEGAFSLVPPALDQAALTAFVVARLKRRPASLADLTSALVTKEWSFEVRLRRLLAELASQRLIAQISPERYFALPWLRLGMAYVPPRTASTGYYWQALQFWVSRLEVPDARQEPLQSVRDEVATQLAFKRERTWPRQQKPAVRTGAMTAGSGGLRTQKQENDAEEDARRAAELKRRETLMALQQVHPWLVTPSGTVGLVVLGIRCRIDVAQLPEGRLWQFLEPDDRQVSAMVKNGRLLTTYGTGMRWSDSSPQVVAHFQAAVQATHLNRLKAYPLGADVLMVLTTR